jgi:lipopolysaccharide export system permease protein
MSLHLIGVRTYHVRRPERGGFDTLKRLDRYILKEMAIPILIGTLSFLFMFQINMVIYLFKTLDLAQVPTGAVLKLILLKTPSFLQMTLPIGVAIASSLALARLTRESELTAMRSAGISIRRVLRPVLGVGVLMAALNFYVGEFVIPVAERNATRLQEEVFLISQIATPQSNVVTRIRDYTVSITSVYPDGKDRMRLEGVTLLRPGREGETVILTTPRGVYDKGRWKMERPLMRVLKGNTLLSASTQDELIINEVISVPQFGNAQPRAEDKSFAELRKTIENGKRQGVNTRPLEINYHNRIAVPATCLIFALTGATMALWFSKSGPFLGVFLSLIMVLLYYNGYVIFTEIFARNGWLPAVISAWVPNILFFIFGLWALRRAE